MSDQVERVTLTDAAKELAMDHATLSRLLRVGKGPGVWHEGYVFITREWLDRYKRGDVGFWSVGIAAMPTPEAIPVESPFVKRAS
jgi:hypothetical protein